MIIKKIAAGLCLSCLGGIGIPLFAQPQAPPAVQQLDDNRRFRDQQSLMSTEANLRAPELYAGEDEDVGPQRILKFKPTRTYFEAIADSQYFYTDNTFLTDQDKVSTAIAVNTIQLALAPTPYELSSGAFAPVVGFRSQWYNYGLDGGGDNLDRLNFNAQTILGGAHYIFKQNWRASLTFDYTRLLDQHSYHEFYTEYVPAIGIQKSFPLNERMAISAEWRTAYHISYVDPAPRSDINDRLDNSLTFGLTTLILPKLVVSQYYQITHYYYPRTAFGESRNEYLNSIGMSLAYYFDPRLFVRIFAGADFKQSDDSRAQEYQKLDAGLNLTINLRF